MTLPAEKQAKKLLVTLNYAFLLIFIVLFCAAEYGSWNTVLIVGSCLGLFLTGLSFYYLHVRSGLWRLTHGKTEALDEREVQVTREAFRKSYSVLTVTTGCLVFFIFLTVRFSFLTLTHRGDYSFGLIVTMGLNYLFNTLPASLIAWHESPGKE